ncbi:REC8 meiotic recombination protein b [Leuresthes tenuis]|uniref:REC8 meiotic recombination protein b n=1 Tax=Leuresthes tenuis TaxID=355514 RepID=UPI003B50AA5F
MFFYDLVSLKTCGLFVATLSTRELTWRLMFAATRGIRVTRRDLLRVNVKLTCRDILDYVTAQVPSLLPNQPRPRFSLYLSSQLQYGVVVVYHRQCGILLEEVQQTIDRLLRSKRCIHIDMAESDRMALEVPDNLHMMEEAEGAQDPFFGLMESYQLPSPYKIHPTELVNEYMDIQHSLVPSLNTTLNKEGLGSSSAPITLLEKEPFVINTAEYFEGDDLPEATAREIDLLMDQPDQFRGEVEGQQGEERSRDMGIVSSIEQLKETTLGTERDSVWLLDEETGQPVEVPLTAVAHERTPLSVAMPTPLCGSSEKVGDGPPESPYKEDTVPPRKHAGGRRRQLVFADPEVQISNTAMQEQIGSPLTETLVLSEVLLDFSLRKHATPGQLFSAPCGSLLHHDLSSLWKRQASLTVLPGSGDEQRAEGESAYDMEILRAERRRRHSRMKGTRSESGSQPTEGSSVSDVILDVSKEDKAGSDVITPISRWSPQEEVQPPMEPIAEENIEMPEAHADTESRNMLSWIASSLQRLGEVTFDSLLPPEADRSTAAHTLYKLLELLSAKQVTVSQTETYGNITIRPESLRMAA